MKSLRIIFAGLLLTTAAYAQKGVEDGSVYGHGEDSVRCITNLMLYGDQLKANNMAEAYPAWTIVFNECPLAYKTKLYNDGVKIVNKLCSAEKDAAKKEEYFQVLMKIYDQRMKYYGNNKSYPTSYIKGLKANSILDYKKDDLAAVKEANELSAAAVAGEPKTVQSAFVLNYLSTSVTLFKEGQLAAEEVVNRYLKCSELIKEIEAVTTNAKIKESLDQAKVAVEQIFAVSGAADCETLASIFAPQLDSNKENLGWLKRVNKLLVNGECVESDLFYATSECLHRIEPSSSSAYGLAKMYIKQKDMEKTLSYYNEAVSLEEDSLLKGRYYLEMGYINLSTDNYSAAKAAAINAAKVRPNWGLPYILLGKIYAAGAKTIGSKDYERKAGFWAAVDKFAKAKQVDSDEKVVAEAQDLVRQYSQYFPSKEELFFEGVQPGSTYTVGGWIGETTTVRAK